tara:strand:+ start:81 stop:344 length:264 start_codon:yes stop_codon:yes gene_type:complete
MERLYVKIYGKVQGVYFRDNVKDKADKLEVKGFVKNVDDHVEAVFEGEDLDEVIKFCKKGPLGARVDKIEVKEEKYKGEFRDFEVRY